MRIYGLILLLVLGSLVSKAQTTCTALGQNPQTAFPVCGTSNFHQSTVPFCGGFAVATTPGCGGQGLSDKNPFWYKFTCYTAGTLGFLITPDNNNEDYDWQLYDITGHAYNEVYSNGSLIIACNWSGFPGITGTNAAAASVFQCGGSTPIFSTMPNLIVAHEYLLLISHYSDTPNGYTLSFSKGTAVITDPVVPNMVSTTITCDNQHVNIKLNKRILCNSIASDGSDFTINAPGITVTNAVSVTCSNSFDTDELTLTLSASLPAGPYTIAAKDGTDFNTLLDFCGTPLPIGTTVPVIATAITATAVDNISYTGCAPTVLNVKLTKPVFCNTITFSGSNGEITIQPGNIIPLSLQGVCTGTSQVADLIHVNLTNPLPFGNYQLVINAASADGNTFIDTCGNELVPITIPFTITQTTTPPLFQSIIYDECHRDRLVVNFNKPVACASLTPDGSEFRINTGGAGGMAPSSIASNCGANGYTTQVTLFFASNLPTQTFNVMVFKGTDGTTLSDTCYAFMPEGYNIGLTPTLPPKPVFDSVQFDNCNPTFVKAFFSHPIKCNTVIASGWPQFAFSGPSTNNIGGIVGATTDPSTCPLGYTNWILFQLGVPVTIAGNYTLMATNNFGLVRDTCDMPQVSSDRISLTMFGKPLATFTSQVKFGCKMDTITFSHPGGNGINSWLWTFSDGSTATGQTVTKFFPVSTVTTTVQLKVDNGFCNDVVTKDITLDNAFSAAFAIAPKDTTCINTPITFTNTSTGKNLQYLWQFGDNTQFNGQTPPPHVYTASSAYNIKLAVTDPYGCTDIATTALHIAALPTVDFTGLATQYCTDKTIALTRIISNNIFTYTWDNGDGVTISSQPKVQFSYPKEGVYTIKLTGTDKYCGATQVSKLVSVFAVPKLNLGNDTVLCPATPMQIGVPFTNGYNYLWNTGASTSQIVTDINTANYSLLIDNNGCKAMDDISVKVLVACLIKVPNAFTPNSDGVNDVLRATSADLAKEFTFKVYNRFGELMFTSSNPLEGWNGYYKGVRATAGTYVWQLAYIDPWSNKRIFESGTSILIR